MFVKNVRILSNGSIGAYVRKKKSDKWRWQFISKKILKGGYTEDYKHYFDEIIILLKKKRKGSLFAGAFNKSYKNMIKYLEDKAVGKINAKKANSLINNFEKRFLYRIQKSINKKNIFRKKQQNILRDIENKITELKEEINKELNIKKYRYVIIGAGPIGLFTAINLIKNNLLTIRDKILIIEKRDTFSRQQILLINKDSQKLLEFLDLEKNGCYVFRPPINKKSKCYTKNDSGAKPFTLMTSKLQKALLNYLRFYYSENIDFLNVVSWEKNSNKDNIIIKKHGTNLKETIKYDFIIGADGFKSDVRKELLNINNKFENFYTNTYGIIFIFKIKNSMRNFIKNETIPVILPPDNKYNMPQNKYRFFFDKDGYIYIGLQLSKGVITKLGGFSEIEQKAKKNEFLNNCENLKKYLNTSILGGRGLDLHSLSLKKESIFEINLGYFKNNAFNDISNEKKNILLVGDSLYGTNFFSGTGVNYGFCFANRLIKFLEGNINVSQNNYDKKINYNDNYVNLYNSYIDYINNKITQIKGFSSGVIENSTLSL